MQSVLVIAAAFASVVAAQTTGAPAPTGAPSDSNANAINVPADGKMPAASGGEDYSLSWNTAGAADNGVTIRVVYGPSTALETGPAVFSATNNPGSATFSVPTGLPNGQIAFVIEEEGEAVNYSPQLDFSGGSDSAPSGSETAEPTGTASGASTLETVASTSEPEPTDIGELPSGNTTVTGGANTAIETDAVLPTETEEAEVTATPTGNSGSSAVKVSFAALFAGLAATFFAL